MAIKWRKWNNIFHRDLGYVFFGMTVIYALSGIALNHIADWNPNYVISHEEVRWTGGQFDGAVSKDEVLAFLSQYDEQDSYKHHYYPAPGVLKVFLQGGSVQLDMNTGTGTIERIRKRPIFYEVNYLHYNPKRAWTWFSDIFCVGLITISITGLFVLKGRKGITGRGAWLTGLGIVLPLVFLFMYL
ncbi:hypothetical protein GF377_01850 [candidate division GN15 bacterium]|nr:hypothetical protein [candidate division GN15 bacterium]